MVTFLTPLASNFEEQKGSIGLALTFLTRTENQNQMSFYPFALREISVLTELILGHLRCPVEDVPPQPNSPPKAVSGYDPPRRTFALKFKHVLRNFILTW